MSGIVDDMKIADLKSSGGFTLMEFTTVIAVIGILVAISVIGYGAWQQNLPERVIKSELTEVATAMQSELNKTNSYPTSVPDSYQPGKDTAISYISGSSSAYCVEGYNMTKPTAKYRISSDSKTDVQSGSCPLPPAPPTGPPAPTTPSITLSGPYSGKVSGVLTTWYTATAGDSICSVGTVQWLFVVSPNPSPVWTNGSWQTSNTYNAYTGGTGTAVQKYVFVKPRCFDSSTGLSTDFGGYTYASLGGGGSAM